MRLGKTLRLAEYTVILSYSCLYLIFSRKGHPRRLQRAKGDETLFKPFIFKMARVGAYGTYFCTCTIVFYVSKYTEKETSDDHFYHFSVSVFFCVLCKNVHISALKNITRQWD